MLMSITSPTISDTSITFLTISDASIASPTTLDVSCVLLLVLKNTSSIIFKSQSFMTPPVNVSNSSYLTEINID